MNISSPNLSIKEILEQIEQSSEVRFSYSDDVVPVSKKVTLNLKNVSLDLALRQIFANTFIDFRENGLQVILYRKKLNLNPEKQFTVSGFIREASSGEPLLGVNIVKVGTMEGTTTNAYGFYSLQLSSDTFRLRISYVGYETMEEFVLLDQDISLNISLNDRTELQEVVVAAKLKEAPAEIQRISVTEIPIPQINDIPAVFGEKDVFKAMRLMPGVTSGAEGQAGMFVRGGGPDQNLVILDDAVVYNAFHMFGLFSLFNGDALRSAELIKGGFPARYGGRLSSVMDIHMKDGNKKEYHGSGGLGLISSRLTLEGPIKKDVSSFLITGRRVYWDLLINPLLRNLDQSLTFYFYDITAKADWSFSDKDKLYLSFYHGRDRYGFVVGSSQYSNGGGVNWENMTGTLRWNHVFNNRLFMNASLIYSNYDLRINAKTTFDFNDYEARIYSSIRDISTKADFDFNYSKKHKIRFGGISTFHIFTPHGFYEENSISKRIIEQRETFYSLESAAYLEDEYQLSSRASFQNGVRVSHFYADGKSYLRAEPRILFKYELTKKDVFKASYTLMNQYIHLLTSTGVGLPTDLWVPSTQNVGPERSQMGVIGYGRELKKLKSFLSLEAYYKHSRGVIGYKEGATFVDLSGNSVPNELRWEQNVTQGKSWSYGAEFLIQKKIGDLTGWIGYTLSWTYLQFDELNRGEKFFARYDRRHDVSIVGTYHLNKHITLSGTWVYGTGNAITLPEASFFAVQHSPGNPDFGSQINGLMVLEYGLKNQYRMRAYHRMDIGIQFTKQKKYFERTWEISLYNAYNRRNTYFYSIATDSQGIARLKQNSLFPILPSVSYSFKF
ncbi:MAG: TonB-dependent receptor [Bacteroidota bacterium]|nr:TonB-dependent receptor [Bacteroidota bacterium]MDX5431401.1 TonB-dependent receptor [Bacteroidota bacterium]MDX5470129.1 TonB-dependent receptor [Bacteroidota bacterium]